MDCILSIAGGHPYLLARVPAISFGSPRNRADSIIACMEHFTCSHGHHWEIAADGTGAANGLLRYCPVCGSPHQTLVLAGPRTNAPPVSPNSAAAGMGNPSIAIPGCELLGELGRGGMGVVYKARLVEANRLVAVKMILAGAYAGPAQVQRFRTEADAAARLHHPNIVKLYDVGEQDGRPYCLLEYVSGSNLAHQLDGTPWPARQAASLIRVLAEAMHVAHGLGIVHRDLKPGNVLLTEEGIPKITDFGLAKILDHSNGPTQSGDLLGTPCYIAPEQADRQNRPITAAVDVYALGAILYELLTGRPPFKGETPLDTVLQVVNDEPVPVSRLQPKVPPDLETICMKCLEKDPRRRYGSAQELGEELGRFLHHQPIHARPLSFAARLARWCKRNPSLAATGGLALLLLQATVVLSVWFAIQQSLDAEQLRNSLQVRTRLIARQDFTQGRNLCELGEPAAGLLWMGRGLTQAPLDDALENTLRTNLRTWAQTLHPLRALQTVPGGLQHAAFSADGLTLATASWGAAVWTWEPEAQQWRGTGLVENVTVSLLALSANGKTAATLRGTSIVEVWDTTSGEQRHAPLEHAKPVSVLALSATGRWLLTEGTDHQVRIWDTESGKLTATLPHPRALVLAVFSSHDERWLFTADSQGDGLVWNLETRQRVARFVHGENITVARFHPKNPQIVFTGSQGGAVRFWEVPEPEPLRTVQHGQAVRALAISSNGEKLYTASEDRTARGWEVETGQSLWEPLQHRGSVHALSLSPNGQTLLTVSADQTVRLWDVQNGHPVGAPIQHQNEIITAAFAPGGRTVLTATGSGLLRGWQVAAPLSPRLLFDHGEMNWVLAADLNQDGKLLLAGTHTQGALLWDATTGKRLGDPILNGQSVLSVVLSPDGRLAALAVDETQMQWQLWEVPGGKSARAVLEHPEAVLSATFSADGRKLLAASVERLYVWDVQTGKLDNKDLAWPDHVVAVAFSADAARAALAIWEHRSEVWDSVRGARVGKQLTHAGRPLLIAANQDGTRLAVGTDDRTVQVWLPESGQALGPPLQHAGPLNVVALSPDGQTVLTVSEGVRLRLWNPILGQPLGPPLTLQTTVNGGRFSPDRETYLTRTDNVVRVWPLPKPLEGDVARVVLTLEVLTGMSLENSDVLHVLGPDRWQERRQRLQEMGGPLLP